MNTRRWRGEAAVCGMAVVLVAGGCGPSGPAGAGGAATADPAKPQRRFLSIGTAPAGGAFFVVGGALAEVASKHTADRGWQVSAEATKGTQENLRRLAKGELDLGLANASITYFAVRGEGKWERPMPIRSVMTLAPNVALFLAPTKSGIRTLADLKGRRVVIGPSGAGFEVFVEPILKAHGLSLTELHPLYDTQAGAVSLLSDGSADAAFLGGAIPTASITQACADGDMTLIPFGEAERRQLIDQYPFFEDQTIPAGTYRGQDAALPALNVGSMQLVTSASAAEDLVYTVARVLYEHAAEVAEKHPAGKGINARNAAKETGTPYHPGAIRYYREIGIWPEPETAGAGGGEP